MPGKDLPAVERGQSPAEWVLSLNDWGAKIVDWVLSRGDGGLSRGSGATATAEGNPGGRARAQGFLVGSNILIYDPNNGPWIDIESFSNSRRFEIPGLERGKDIWVRVRARNSNGAGPWSDPATAMVN